MFYLETDENQTAMTTAQPWTDDIDAGFETVWGRTNVIQVSAIALLMLLTLLGNVALIVIIISRAELRHKRVNVFILNLAVGDLNCVFHNFIHSSPKWVRSLDP